MFKMYHPVGERKFNSTCAFWQMLCFSTLFIFYC
uniref:Uncharacterized protein n=1 Tax=Anguilla anguilla TaxID=7936 RepID=A0A0E9Q060_ANGAN